MNSMEHKVRVDRQIDVQEFCLSIRNLFDTDPDPRIYVVLFIITYRSYILHQSSKEKKLLRSHKTVEINVFFL